MGWWGGCLRRGRSVPLNRCVTRQGNRLEIQTLDSGTFVPDLVGAIRDGLSRGYESFDLVFPDSPRIFPNAAAPLAALLDYYRSSCSIDFEFVKAPAYIFSKVLSPVAVSSAERAARVEPLNQVWSFSSPSEIGVLTNSIVRSVASAAVCRKGVLNALAWCLYEVFDNVLLHAEVPGFTMAQIHPNTQHIAICIFDCGPGVYNTLKQSHNPSTAEHALQLAVRQGVTSGKGMGNGLWGLHDIVACNSGRLAMTSGGGFYGLIKGQPVGRRGMPFPSYANNTMMVDFQIDFDKPIEISSVLQVHKSVDWFVDELEDHFGNVVYPVLEKAPGLGLNQAYSVRRCWGRDLRSGVGPRRVAVGCGWLGLWGGSEVPFGVWR